MFGASCKRFVLLIAFVVIGLLAFWVTLAGRTTGSAQSKYTPRGDLTEASQRTIEPVPCFIPKYSGSRADAKNILIPLLDAGRQSESNEDPRIEYYRVRKLHIDSLVQNQAEYEAAINYIASFKSWKAICEDEDGSAFYLGHVLFHAVLERKDTATLCWLLSKVLIQSSGPDGLIVEYALVALYNDLPISNILVLFDAYQYTNDKTIREHLMYVIRRAFADRIKPSFSDEYILKVTRAEFEKDMPSLKVNRRWQWAEVYGFWLSNVIAPPLFIPIDGPDEVQETVVE